MQPKGKVASIRFSNGCNSKSLYVASFVRFYEMTIVVIHTADQRLVS